ncbi:MAG: hypothetical protein E7052_06735 [Lentisphaerae bacterium]|nr:hypothetical protein [Lentisphaerota bacterium]
MDWSFRKNWDEYTWSAEIRKDEQRIAGYFRALPNCLDLPGEDELIFTKLMSQPELVPTGVSDPQRMLRNEFDYSEEEAEEWDAERREARRRSNFEPSKRLENLAAEWNLLAASQLEKVDLKLILAVTCAFGKLLSRIYNFEETEESDETLALRISLLKRMLTDLNEVLKEFKALPESAWFCLADFFEALSIVREQILDKLNDLRSC